ncbi:MAG TPA: amidohydrolase family protein [Steroidobacteraceae bacterium]|nr:amidohydrolase family protein [Steroidobacteraceae bacterium]
MSIIFRGLAALLLAAVACSAVAQTDRCAGAREIRIVNGRIHTMDARDSVVSSATIRRGLFAPTTSERDACMQVIDVHGRTVVPGLIDNHNHIVLLSERPGRDTRLESATSIADVQASLRARSHTVSGDAWITAMGGWIPGQLAEKRLPTLAELDQALPGNPALLFVAFTGPAVTNSKGRAYLASHGVAVSDAGLIAAGPASLAAMHALAALQTLGDKKQGVLDAMAYSAALGVTTNVDMGEFVEPGTRDIKDSFIFDGLASGDPFAMYEPFLALHREGKLLVRLRVFFLSMDQGQDFPMTRERVLNAFNRFGDDMLRISGVGEFATSWPLFGPVSTPPNYLGALQFIAAHGWAFQQHSLSLAEDKITASTFEAVNAVTPIASLHWSDAHVPQIDLATVNRFKAIGAGIAVHPYKYLSDSSDVNAGPPVRMILDSGVHAGAGSDSAQISTLNPWNMIYYMVTGMNAGGHLVNAGQTVSREEALRLYTADNGWFFREEGHIGSIEPGELGDLVVLSDDYFDAKKVPDSELRKLHSVLTVVDGKVIYRAL